MLADVGSWEHARVCQGQDAAVARSAHQENRT